MAPLTRSYRTLVEAASLVLGPLLMSTGDLMHPKEETDAADQAASIIEHASRWYTAHLLLFIGIIAFIPGILALASLTAERRPSAGYAARILILAGVAVFAAVTLAEMLIGRYASDGADKSATTELLETFQSGWVLSAVAAGVLLWFAGVVIFVAPLVMAGGWLRWPAVTFVIGALLILIEIATSQVLFSQIGNVVVLVASGAFAWHIVTTRTRQHAVTAGWRADAR